MKHFKLAASAICLTGAALLPHAGQAQTFTENFTGTSTSNSWYFINGACLTAGTAASNSAASPACVGLPYYSLPNSPANPSPQIGGYAGTLAVPDPVNNGALRFTDWYHQTGAILSNFAFTLSGAGAQGLQVSFTTVSYGGDSGGTGKDGADGMSFFLQDATYPPDVGAFGGSLGYSCSNTNNDTYDIRATNGVPRGYDGLSGAYIGLGIDEYGNFLNSPDNTSTGTAAPTGAGGTGQFQWGRIGMRGPGNTAWTYLNQRYNTQYPNSLTTLKDANGNLLAANAVQNSCKTGFVWDYSNPNNPVKTTIPLPNYAVIPGASSVLPSTRPIANENSTVRGNGTPITYNLKVTTSGLLSLSYSYNGGALQNVITNQDITAGGTVPIPANVRFGFAGSTGGSRNVHEIMCFQATPSNDAESSAGLNLKQTAKVQIGTQVYFAFYNPTTLAGSLTSQYLGTPVGDPNPNDLAISSTINWDGSCVLTGLAAGQVCDTTGPVGPVAPQGFSSSSSGPSAGTRVILSWNGSTGIPFEWGNLTAAQQSALDAGDGTAWVPAPPYNYSRLYYLRGDRSNEQTPTSSTTFSGTFRARKSVLGDIIHSSPTWVGPPNAGLPNSWIDKYDTTGDPYAENSGQTYAAYVAAMQTRTNVVFAGANDGMLHGFRSGYFSTPTTYQSALNDGREVFAYVPGYIVNNIQNATNAYQNFSDPQYGHRYDVDAPPGTGDLFYGGVWHSWLVGGLGQGGNAIYALDITNMGDYTGSGLAGSVPTSESSATAMVKGEWSLQGGVSTLNCVNVSNCGFNLGRTFGVPQIRRFHNGSWGAVFGNGNQNGQTVGGMTYDAGIFVMLVDPGSGAITFYYFSTGVKGTSTKSNGIYYTAAADLDGDHIVDYVYAGDLFGNVWRFDLTSTNPNNWGVTNASGVSINSGGGNATPLFVTQTGQPITTQIVATSIAGTTNPRVMLEFGTGQETPFGNFTAANYAQATQSLYGIWDWNLATWNSHSSVQYASLPNGSTSAPSSPISGTANILQQTIGGPYTATAAGTGSDYRTLTSAPVCWADTTGCSQYGWYINLVTGYANAGDPATPSQSAGACVNTASNPAPCVYEQITYNPTFADGALLINTTIPPATAALMCFSASASGWTMAINPANGGAFTNGFFGDASHHYLNVSTGVGTQPVSGIAVGGTGTPSVVVSGTQSYFVTQTVSGVGYLDAINPPSGTKGTRLTWTEKR